VDDKDTVTLIERIGHHRVKLAAWTCRVDPTADPQGTAKYGVEPGATVRRGMSFDPAWFEDTDPPDPPATEKRLADLPANKWVPMKPPRTLLDRCWGTQILDPDRDQILHWTGGHVSHCGTNPAHYGLQTNRWSIGFAPANPLEVLYSASVSATYPASTFGGRPFLPHTYRSYCYEPTTRRLLWTHEQRSWWYDPDRREWDPERPETPFQGERHTTVLCPTAHGVAAWAAKRGVSVYTKWYGVWLLTDPKQGTWVQLAAPDGKTVPPGAYGDRHGMAYDARRDRLLLMHFGLPDKHKVWAFDLKTRRMTILEPDGSDAVAESASMAREALYLPDDDLVLVCTRAKPEQLTLLYDPAENRWRRLAVGYQTDAKGRRIGPGYGVSTGVMWDPKRKLVWASDVRGNVFVLRFDRKAAGIRLP
jgi:hypothetical protein